MATDIRNLPANLNASDATFREWCQGVDAALIACGLVAYPQTGEADLTTIVAPTAGQSQIQKGFKCYRFNDDLQATKPIFIRVDFGSGSTNAKPALWLNVGTLMNGSGGFLGIVTLPLGAFQGGGSSVKAAGARLDQYASGIQGSAPGGGRIWLVTCFDPGDPCSTGFVIERLKTANGAYHPSGGVFIGFMSGQASNQIRCCVLVHGLSPVGGGTTGNNWPIVSPTLGVMSPAVGSDLALSPLMISRGQWLYGWPLCYRDSDMARLVPFTLTHLGGSRVYMPIGPNYSGSGIVVPGGGSSSDALAFPWE